MAKIRGRVAQVPAGAESISFGVKVIRADGTVEDHGTVAYWHRRWWRRLAWRLGIKGA